MVHDLPHVVIMIIRTARLLSLLLWLLELAAGLADAHEHHGAHLEPGNELKPIDRILWLHVYVQVVIWWFAFPLGVVFGLTRSRWHVPLQVTATAITLGGVWLGHAHGGRAFPHSQHGSFADWLFWIILAQAAIGIYLKSHVQEGTIVRKAILAVHSVLGRLYPVIGYIQMLLGVIVGLGYCDAGTGRLGQCLAHHIMGSSFIGYGIFLLVMSMYGSSWLKRRGMSQEFLDSTVIMVFGVCTTFTMHGFLEPAADGWNHRDYQHTALGVLFWTGGALGMYMGRQKKRNIWPGLVIVLTGFAMSGHEQATVLSTKAHSEFGYTLMLAGICRIIEVCFVGIDSAAVSTIHLFSHLCPFLLVAAGLQFMAATDEELSTVEGIGMDSTTHTVALFCVAFFIYLWANILITAYHTSGRNAPAPENVKPTSTDSWWRLMFSGATSHLAGSSSSLAKEEVSYDALPDSASNNIELGCRHQDSGHNNMRAIYDADIEVQDDGDDAYWNDEPRTAVRPRIT